MNVMTATQFGDLSTEQKLKVSPVKITSDGEVIGIFALEKDFIFIGDMHPRVQQQLRARENMVRMGMPKDVKVG